MRFYCNFLPKLENITPFLRWKKGKEKAHREMYFHDIETNQML